MHDECNGSDVFGSDICTCRPYLVHGIEEAVKTAQRGGVGIVVYFRKEGRALGEVTKFLVYNARKRQTDGDSAATYFTRTRCVAGVEDARFQELMPDPLHWFGITKIDNLMSMSNMKYDAIVASGIKVMNRREIPDHLVPSDGHVELDAKRAAGYFLRVARRKNPPPRGQSKAVDSRSDGERGPDRHGAMPHTPGADAVLVDRLLSPAAVRAGARGIFDLAAAGGTHFSFISSDWTMSPITRSP